MVQLCVQINIALQHPWRGGGGGESLILKLLLRTVAIELWLDKEVLRCMALEVTSHFSGVTSVVPSLSRDLPQVSCSDLPSDLPHKPLLKPRANFSLCFSLVRMVPMNNLHMLMMWLGILQTTP